MGQELRFNKEGVRGRVRYCSSCKPSSQERGREGKPKAGPQVYRKLRAGLDYRTLRLKKKKNIKFIDILKGGNQGNVGIGCSTLPVQWSWAEVNCPS